MTELIPRTREALKEAEGFRSKKYNCSKGVPSIGHGRAETKGLTKDEANYLGTGWQGLKQVTKEQALYLLNNDIAENKDV